MRVLVTGAGGFVGFHVATALAAVGKDVLAGVHRSVPDRLRDNPGVRLVPFDLSSDMAPEIDGPVDAIVHCAAVLPSCQSDPDRLYRANVAGMTQLIAIAKSRETRTFLHCSSMSAYGRISMPVVGADTPDTEPDAYGRSKSKGERLLDEATADGGLAALSLRLPGIVGRGSHDNFLSSTLGRIRAGERVQARNPDALFNNIVHVTDLTVFMHHLLDALPSGHCTIPIASDRPVPIRSVLSALFEELGLAEAVDYSEAGQPFLIDPEPARALGFAVPATLDSVRRFARDYREQPGPGR